MAASFIVHVTMSSLTLSCRSSRRSLMMSCLSSAGMRSAGQAVSSVSTRLLQDCRACRFALRLRRTRLRSTTCCRMEFTSWKNTPGDRYSYMKRHLCFGFYLHGIQSINDGDTVACSVRQYGASLIIHFTQYVTKLHRHHVSLVLVHTPPLTEASVRWLPFPEVHLPQQPALYEATAEKDQMKNDMNHWKNTHTNKLTQHATRK